MNTETAVANLKPSTVLTARTKEVIRKHMGKFVTV